MKQLAGAGVLVFALMLAGCVVTPKAGMAFEDFANSCKRLSFNDVALVATDGDREIYDCPASWDYAVVEDGEIVGTMSSGEVAILVDDQACLDDGHDFGSRDYVSCRIELAMERAEADRTHRSIAEASRRRSTWAFWRGD